jgi:hypothetical protein
MTVTLYLAPAAAGKTAYLVAEARRLAQNLTHTPRVVVPTRLQARAWRRRLAEAGGALADRDLAALNALKDVLRGLVWIRVKARRLIRT